MFRAALIALVLTGCAATPRPAAVKAAARPPISACPVAAGRKEDIPFFCQAHPLPDA